MLTVVMLSVIMLNVDLLIVVGPFFCIESYKNVFLSLTLVT